MTDKIKTPITTQEASALLALNSCTYLPGSSAKRFVRDMHEIYVKTERLEDMTLSDAQHKYFHDLAWRYRKQLIRYRFFTPRAWQPESETLPKQDELAKMDAWRKMSEK